MLERLSRPMDVPYRRCFTPSAPPSDVRRGAEILAVEHCKAMELPSRRSGSLPPPPLHMRTETLEGAIPALIDTLVRTILVRQGGRRLPP